MVAPRRLGNDHNFYRSRPDSPKHITKVCQNGIIRRHSFLLVINSLSLLAEAIRNVFQIAVLGGFSYFSVCRGSKRFGHVKVVGRGFKTTRGK